MKVNNGNVSNKDKGEKVFQDFVNSDNNFTSSCTTQSFFNVYCNQIYALLNYNRSYNFLKSKYFFVLCFYLKKHYLSNYISDSLFLGYKYHYVFLNASVLFKTLKRILNLIKTISQDNGTILVLYTGNRLLNYILKENCKKNKIYFLPNFNGVKHFNLIRYLEIFPDLVISFDYKTNSVFLNKIKFYNVPIICFTNLLNKSIVENMMYYLVFNNTSFYSNLMVIYLVFDIINKYKKKLGI